MYECYPTDTQRIPKGYLRDTQGNNMLATPAQYRSNTGAIPGQYRSSAVSAPGLQSAFPKAGQGMSSVYLVALSKGTSACPPSGSLNRRTWVPDVSAVAHDRDKVEVVFGVTSTKNSTVR